MKKLLIITILILTGCTRVGVHEENVELTLTTTESDRGKYQIRSMEDYKKYYIDTVLADDNQDKNQVIIIALEDGYLNNPEGSDVYIHTKNRLIGNEEDIDKRIALRERFLEDYQDYTYTLKSRRGDKPAQRDLIAGVVSKLSKDLAEVGRKREATELIKTFLQEKHSGVTMWLQLHLLELYQKWVLEMDVSKSDKQFSGEVATRLKPLEQVENLNSINGKYGRYPVFVRLNALIQAR